MVHDGRFFFGAHVYRVPAVSLQNVFDDLVTMKQLGMNLVNIQESWAWDNPQEGVYDFAELMAIVDAAGRLDLNVSVTLTMEQVPKWVWDKYPDCRLLNAYNEPHEDPTQYVLPSDGKPGPCWDHEGVKAEAARFITELARRFGDVSLLVYWNVWQEIGFASRPGASRPQTIMPYNRETLAAFRHYLREKYDSLERLNAAWRTRFPTWESVDPPRMYFAVPAYPDWRRFALRKYLGDVVAERTRLLNAAPGTPRPTAFHTASPCFGSTCEFHWSKHASWYGTSLYPTVQTVRGWEKDAASSYEAYRRQEQWACLFHLNYSRCANAAPWMQEDRVARRFLVSELGCGPFNYGLRVRAEVTCDQVRRWLLLCVAAGAQSIVLWNTRPEHFGAEAQGQGFLDGRGALTPRTEAVRAFGGAVAKDGEGLARSAKPPSQVALVLDDDAFVVSEGLGEVEPLVHSLRGCYKALFEMGADPDFLDIHGVPDPDLARYKALVLPFPVAMSGATVATLRRYAEQGGTVISGPTPARFDEYGTANLCFLSSDAERLFGVAHAGIHMVAERGAKNRWTPPATRFGDVLPPQVLRGEGLLKGLTPVASYYIQHFAPDGASPVLRWVRGDSGDPAPKSTGLVADSDRPCVVGTAHAVGRGKTYLFGTMFGYSILGEGCGATVEALARVLKSAGVGFDKRGPIVRQKRLWERQEFWSFLNTSDQDARWPLDDLPAPSAADLLTGEVLKQADPVLVRPFDLRCLVVDR